MSYTDDPFGGNAINISFDLAILGFCDVADHFFF